MSIDLKIVSGDDDDLLQAEEEHISIPTVRKIVLHQPSLNTLRVISYALDRAIFVCSTRFLQKKILFAKRPKFP